MDEILIAYDMKVQIVEDEATFCYESHLTTSQCVGEIKQKVLCCAANCQTGDCLSKRLRVSGESLEFREQEDISFVTETIETSTPSQANLYDRHVILFCILVLLLAVWLYTRYLLRLERQKQFEK